MKKALALLCCMMALWFTVAQASAEELRELPGDGDVSVTLSPEYPLGHEAHQPEHLNSRAES